MLWFSGKVFLGIGILCYLLIVLFSRQFFSLFAANDAELVASTRDKSLVYFSGFFLAGLNILLISYWQSTQETSKALAVSLLRSIIAPPILTILLSFAFGSAAIWVCHSLSETLTVMFALCWAKMAYRAPHPQRKTP